VAPVWSPDGTKILFNTDRDGDQDLYVMDEDGSNPTNASLTLDSIEGLGIGHLEETTWSRTATGWATKFSGLLTK
jgi:Tol biopolymer transport system component